MRSNSSTNIGNTLAVGTKDPETVTKEIAEEQNKWTSEPIIERDTSSSSQPTEYASCPVKKEQDQEKSYAAVKKYPQQKNLKLLIPIIIVALVIGSGIAFAIFSTTITTTPVKIFSNMTEITETTTTTTPPSERLNNQDNNIHGILANVASGRCYRISLDKI